MKKSLVILSLILVSFATFGSVSAAVDFMASVGGAYSDDVIAISWENGTYATSNLMYAHGVCDGTLPGVIIVPNVVSNGSENWDVSDFEDGMYCLKIAEGSNLHGDVTIARDTKGPTVEFFDSYYIGENGSAVLVSYNFSDVSGIDYYIIDFGDGNVTTVNSSDGNIMDKAIGGVFYGINVYSEEGRYTITLTVVDFAGNFEVVTVPSIISSEVSDWLISLSADRMNAFSIPFMPEDSDIENVLDESVSDSAEKIWSYQQGKWKYNVPTSSGWSDSSSRIKDIIPGYGYILFMKEDSVIYGKKVAPGVSTPTQKIEMVSGWNFVGVNGGNKTITRALSSVDLGDSYRWNEVRDSNWGFISNYTSPVGIMASTRAYWVSVITDDGPIYL